MLLFAATPTDTSAATAHGAARSVRSVAALIVLLVVTSAICWSVRWISVTDHASGDTFWYTRLALEYRGSPESEATVAAAGYLVALSHVTDPAPTIELAQSIDARYPAIFASRPVYPLVAAALMPFFGLDAMIAAAALGATLFAVALGLVAFGVTGRAMAAVLAVVAAYALPLGSWLVFLYADGWMFAWLALTLGAATASLRGGGRGWLLVFACGLVFLYGSKTANGVVVVIAVVALWVLVAIAGHASARSGAALASIAVTIGAGQVALFGLLGAPGLAETLQDYFTRHFAVPDVADPLLLLLQREVTLVPWMLLTLILNPIVLIVAALGLGPLLVVRAPWALLWVLAGVATAATVLVHPVISEVPRLMAPIWVSVSLGLVIWAARIRFNLRPG